VRARTIAILVTLSVVSLTMAKSVSAQSGSAEAAELFKQGRVALQAKDFATACPKFDASLKLERAVGTLISLADCEQATGKLAGARQHWEEAAAFADASRDALHRGAYARQKFAEIDKRVPKLIVRLVTGAPKDTAVRRDTVDLGATSFDAPLPVDPGVHSLVAIAPNHEAKTFTVELKEGEQKTVEVGPGNETSSVSASSTTPLAVPAPTVAPSPSSAAPEAPAQSTNAMRMVGLVTAGVGVVGLGLGSAFGLQAISKKSDANCTSNKVCPNDAAASTFRDANSAASLSTIFFATGAFLAAAGITIYVVAPKDSASPSARVQITPSVAMGNAGMTVLGAW
jgi:hypothetical protein